MHICEMFSKKSLNIDDEAREDSLRVPWTARRSNLKEINPEHFSGRTDAEAPGLWPPDAMNPLLGKNPDAEKD